MLGANPFPGGLELDAGLHLGGTSSVEFDDESVPRRGIEDRAGRRGVLVAFRDHPLDRGIRDGDRLAQGTHGLREPLPFGGGCFEGDPGAAEQLAALGEAGFEGAQRGGRLSGVDLGEVQLLAAFGECLLATFDARGHPDEATLCAVALGDQFELAGCRPAPPRNTACVTTSPSRVTTVMSDSSTIDRAASKVSTTNTEASSPSTPFGCGDEVGGESSPGWEAAGSNRCLGRARHHDLDEVPAAAVRAWLRAAMPESRSSASTASARVPSAAAIAAS